MAKKYYIGKVHWSSVLKGWMDNYHILAPQQKKGGLFFETVTLENLSTIVYDEARQVQPLKSYFLPSLDNVIEDRTSIDKPLLFLGVKACCLSALPILDEAFKGEFADPLYQKRRRQSLIVSSDCINPNEFCFCTKVEGKPYSTDGFDLNLSKVWDGFVIEVGTENGKALLEGHDNVLNEVVKEEADALEKIRKESIEKVNFQNTDFNISELYYDLISKSWDSEVWKKFSETCVECGVCNHACPTCHCYFLDDVTRKESDRLRGWDSCQYSGYAVTAGGGTPRPRLYERFRNRYFCKFKYLKDNYESYGCTGCGRCIEGCQGDIDMRKVISELVKS